MATAVTTPRPRRFGWFVPWLGWTVAASAAWSLPASGQEDATAAAPVATDGPPRYHRLLYLDPPQPFDPESDRLPAPPATGDGAGSEAVTARAAAIADYEARVAEIESRGGGWDPELAEELLSLGNLHQAQGNSATAIELIDRALHVSRISYGLHAPEQFSAIEALIRSYIALGDWENADTYFNYLLFVQQRAFGKNDPRLVNTLDRLGRWNLQAFNLGYGNPIGMRLSVAQVLFSSAARMVQVHFGAEDERFVQLQRGVANSAYLVSRNPHLISAVNRRENVAELEVLHSRVGQANVRFTQGFSAGEEALLEIIAHYVEREDMDAQLADSLAQLGDWYLAFDRRMAARRRYSSAWDIAGRLDDGAELRERLFGQVLPIPTYAQDSGELLEAMGDNDDADGLRWAYAEFAFDVNRNGGVRNLELLTEPTAANQDLLNRVARAVRQTPFRPRLVAGEPVDSPANYFRYRYWY